MVLNENMILPWKKHTRRSCLLMREPVMTVRAHELARASGGGRSTGGARITQHSRPGSARDRTAYLPDMLEKCRIPARDAVVQIMMVILR